MTTETDLNTETASAQPGFYQKDGAYVRPTDTTGLVFMSIIALILLFSLLRSEKRYRDLMTRLAQM